MLIYARYALCLTVKLVQLNPCNARRVLRDAQAYTEILSIISKFHPDATDYEF